MTRAFPHAMLREIFEQPDALSRTIERYRPGTQQAAESFRTLDERFAQREHLVIAASGSSRHAGLAGEIMLEDLAGVPMDVEYASEYTYRSSRTAFNPGVLAISQSGETADTLAALRSANARGLATAAITNVATSSIAREAGASLPTFAGKELAIPATKSFTTQLAVLFCMALHMAQRRGRLSAAAVADGAAHLDRIPAQLEQALPAWEQQINLLAPSLVEAHSLLYLGRDVHYAIAREGALKLKESAYMNAEGYPAGELKHGPNALVSPETPLLFLATVDWADQGSMLRYRRVLELMKTMRQQGARVIALATEGDQEASLYSEHCLFIPATTDLLATLLEVVPLQLLAYRLSILRGIDVDRPRNLVKAVLAE